MKDNRIILDDGVRLPDGTEVEVRVSRRQRQLDRGVQRILDNQITTPVGMAEMIEEDKREREDRWFPEVTDES